MTVEQILDMTPQEWAHMNKSQMREVANVLNSAANKRVKRLQKYGYSAPEEHFGIKRGATRNQLFKAASKAKNFMEGQKSTIRGYTEWQSNVVEGAEKVGVHIPDEVVSDVEKGRAYWSAVDQAMESVGSQDKKLRYRVMNELSQYDPEELILMRQDGDLEELLENIATEQYEEMQIEELENNEWQELSINELPFDD